MSNSSITFLPWVRYGMGAHEAMPASVDRAHRRVKIDLSLAVGENCSSPGTYTKEVTLKGPAEVNGFSPKLVARTEPVNGENRFQPNYFPFVEFVDPDFPWRYSLNNIDDGKVIPWITLILLKNDEFKAGPISGTNLQTIKLVKPILPDLSDAWAWAHVQLSGSIGPGGSDAKTCAQDHILNQPQLNCSRLMCPRKLEEFTMYAAFVVPTYNSGRLSSLGYEFDLAQVADAFAWSEGENDVELPVYYRWEFQTGEGGDFEELMDRLQFKPVPAGTGTRAIDGSKPGFLFDAAGSEMEFPNDNFMGEGSLVPPGYMDYRPPFAVAGFSEKITEELNKVLANSPLQPGADDEDPLVTIPVYGRYFQKTHQIELPEEDGTWDSDNSWVDELNIDRRSRVAASTGTLIVQDNQEEFMKECWSQVGAINEANALIRHAGTASFLSGYMQRKHLDPLDDTRFTLITQPFHYYYLHENDQGQTSYKERFLKSGLPEGMTTSAFRHILASKVGFTNVDDKVFFYEWTVKQNSDIEYSRIVDQDRNWIIEIIDGFAGGEEGDRTVPVIPSLRSEIIETEVIDIHSKFRVIFDFERDQKERLNDIISVPWLGAIDSFDILMKAPEIDRAMYRYLKDKSVEWLSPGLGKLERNTVTLMEENSKFIEAFMAGLNHEMENELLWREFPTDLRGTVFSYFWDAVDTDNPLKCIKEISSWQNRLGENGSTNSNSGSAVHNLVMVVKADLVRRFPDTIIFAVRTAADAAADQWQDIFGNIDAGITSNADFEIILPVFSARPETDLQLLGFPFTEDEVRSEGYYFIFIQHSTLPGFGLDGSKSASFSSWDDMSFEDVDISPVSGWVKADAAALSQEAAVFNAASAEAKWGQDSSSAAFITYQKPVRIIIPAVNLL